MVLYLAEEETLHSKVISHGVQGFSHVTIDVAHLAQSLDFYVRTLGMEVVHRGRRDVYLTWGTAWVCLQERPELSPLTQQLGVNHVAFYIAPAKFDLLVDVLRQANVPIVRGPLQRGGGWSINFLDPDGVQLECYTATLAERMETWV
ncbi:VOC family protein [Alicyclobacillus fodiniaquatilis]|uniref:VOC family protein n=1 Tax=Alicyclobacillus fodiniaquatilis TaxID=1661150 RepID=A0ABW4JGP0_9BACL